MRYPPTRITAQATQAAHSLSNPYTSPDAASAIMAHSLVRIIRICTRSQRATGRDWRTIRPPPLPPLRALTPPPRLRAKPTSFCAVCADRPGPASAGAAWQQRRFKNCANLCVFLQSYIAVMINHAASYSRLPMPYFSINGILFCSRILPRKNIR